MIRDSQCGCTKGKLCLSNLMATRCTVTVSVDEGGAAVFIYVDFCKACDSVVAAELEDMGLMAGLSDKKKNWLHGCVQRIGQEFNVRVEPSNKWCPSRTCAIMSST